jgi:hypothetical protein
MSIDGPIFDKFIVTHNDGESGPGGRHEFCSYFVLDLTHDPAAIPAVLAYADAVEITHPMLAADIRARWGGSTNE